MPNQDFTTWSPGETDPNSHITFISSRVTATGLTRNEDAWFINDFTAGYFDGDFNQSITVEPITHVSGSVGSFWGMSNAIDDIFGLFTASEPALYLLFTDSLGNLTIRLREDDGGTLYTDESIILSDIPYDLIIVRDETVGSFGQLQCFIYDGITLIDTLTLALHVKTDFRYLWVANSNNTGSATGISFYSENLDLQEAINGFPFFFDAGHY